MPTVLLNTAVPAPVAGPGGPAEPIGPLPPGDAFASALNEAGLAGGNSTQPLPLLPATPGQPLPSLPATPDQPVPAVPGSSESAVLPTEAAVPTPPLAMPAAAALAAPPATAPPGWPPPGLAALFPAPLAVATPPLPAAATARPAPPAALLPLAAGRGTTPLPSAVAPGLVEAQPSALAAASRLPLARERAEEALLLLPERPGAGPGEAESLPWTPPSASGLARLDLATAFPAPLPLHDRRFAESLGGRLQWLADQGGGEVRLRLSPEGLGPVEIRLQLDGDRVDLTMHASLAETRQALEQALPKLREMLAQSGLQLGQADVGQQSAHDRKPDPSGTTVGEGPASIAAAAAALTLAGDPPPRRGEGLLDLYA